MTMAAPVAANSGTRETEHGLLRSPSCAHAPTLDLEHANLGCCDGGWRFGTAWFDGRRPDRRNGRGRARCSAKLHIGRRPYPWRDHRNHIDGASSDDLAKAMRAGSLAVACLADVPDAPILARNEAGVLTATRMPEPGALYKHHLERLDWVDEMVAAHGLRRALSAADLEAAHRTGQPAIVG